MAEHLSEMRERLLKTNESEASGTWRRAGPTCWRIFTLQSLTSERKWEISLAALQTSPASFQLFLSPPESLATREQQPSTVSTARLLALISV